MEEIVPPRAQSMLPSRLIAPLVRALPVHKGQKWRLAGRIGDRLITTDSPCYAKVPMASGFTMLVDVAESYERRMYFSGLYASYLTRVVKRIVAPGDTVIDGGANIGYFSLLAARLVGDGGHVHAFEPIPQTHAALLRNIKLNGFTQVRANNVALSDRSGELFFEVPEDTKTGQALGRLASVAQLGRGAQVSALAQTLDEYAEQAGIKSIRFVKLDLEGSEVAAITGMQRLLAERRIQYLLCEQNTDLLLALGIPRSAMRRMLEEVGYRCYFIRCWVGFARSEHVQCVEAASQADPDAYGDYLFVAPGASAPILSRVHRRAEKSSDGAADIMVTRRDSR